MATLIIVYGPEGVLKRCDANCYDSRGTKCTCVCGGSNHGLGLEAAIENTTRHGRRLLYEHLQSMEPPPEWHRVKFYTQAGSIIGI